MTYPGVRPGLRRLGSLWSRVLDLERTSLLTAVTLLVVLINAGGGVPLFVVMLAAAAVGLLSPRVRTSPVFWLAITLIWASHLWLHRFTADNHKYLTFYWCLAVTLSLWSRSPGETMARNARLLLGLTFLFATIWKVTSPDFLSGDFFHYHLLVDRRLWPVAEILGGLAGDELVRNAELHARLASSGGADAVTLHSSRTLASLSVGLGVGAVALEAIVAAAFLVPVRRPVRWLTPARRSLALWVFALVTYLVVPIMGFGTLLLTLGLAQLRPTDRRVRVVYLVMLVAAPLYLLVWRALVG